MATLTLTGLKGDPGQSFLIGQGAPVSTLGANGDSYVDVVNGYTLYSKSGGAWSQIGALMQTINGKSGQTIVLAASDVGAVAADVNGDLPLSAFPFRTSQATQAIRTVLSNNGSTFATFLASLDDQNGTSGQWESVYVEPTAPIGGILYTAALSFLQRVAGITLALATSQLNAAWVTAASLAP